MNITREELDIFLKSDLVQNAVIDQDYHKAEDYFFEMFSWKPIGTAPKNGTRILTYHENWSAPNTAQYYGGQGWSGAYDSPFKDQPTHWMRLPEAPKNL